jgi:hypothetical protein
MKTGRPNRSPVGETTREHAAKTNMRGTKQTLGAEITNRADEIQGRKLLTVDTKQTVRRARLTSRTFVNEKNDTSTTYVTPNRDQEFEQQNQLLAGTWAHDRDKVTARNEHMEEVQIWCRNENHITKCKHNFQTKSYNRFTEVTVLSSLFN